MLKSVKKQILIEKMVDFSHRCSNISILNETNQRS
jgi:hypothetical protein